MTISSRNITKNAYDFTRDFSLSSRCQLHCHFADLDDQIFMVYLKTWQIIAAPKSELCVQQSSMRPNWENGFIWLFQVYFCGDLQ